MKWSPFFCLVRFWLDFRCALKRAKWPINFGITRYGWLITIIMWCHCRSASESNGHVFTITFFYGFSYISLSIHFGICCSWNRIAAMYVLELIEWVLLSRFGVDWCWYLLLIVYYIWHFYGARNASCMNANGPQVPIKKTRTNCY